MNDSQVFTRKFSIKELLDDVSWSKRPLVRKQLLSLLNVSNSTLYRILNAKPSDKQDISTEQLVAVANFFDVSPLDIINKIPSPETYLRPNTNKLSLLK